MYVCMYVLNLQTIKKKKLTFTRKFVALYLSDKCFMLLYTVIIKHFYHTAVMKIGHKEPMYKSGLIHV